MDRERGRPLLRSMPAVAVTALVLVATLVPTAAMAPRAVIRAAATRAVSVCASTRPPGSRASSPGVPWSGTPQADGETAGRMGAVALVRIAAEGDEPDGGAR